MTEPACPACGVPYREHLGLNGTCAALLQARLEAAALRDQVAAFREHGVSLHKAAARERAAIVAWLRQDQTCAGEPLRDLADAIERGDHCDHEPEDPDHA